MLIPLFIFNLKSIRYINFSTNRVNDLNILNSENNELFLQFNDEICRINKNDVYNKREQLLSGHILL